MSHRKHQQDQRKVLTLSLSHVKLERSPQWSGILVRHEKTKTHKATEMLTLSLSDQATVHQKEIVTILFRPVSVRTSGVWHTVGLKCPGVVTMVLFVANSHWRLI